jgi:hypothetical protein
MASDKIARLARLLNDNFYRMSFSDKKTALCCVITEDQCNSMLVSFLAKYYEDTNIPIKRVIGVSKSASTPLKHHQSASPEDSSDSDSSSTAATTSSDSDSSENSDSDSPPALDKVSSKPMVVSSENTHDDLDLEVETDNSPTVERQSQVKVVLTPQTSPPHTQDQVEVLHQTSPTPLEVENPCEDESKKNRVSEPSVMDSDVDTDTECLLGGVGAGASAPLRRMSSPCVVEDNMHSPTDETEDDHANTDTGNQPSELVESDEPPLPPPVDISRGLTPDDVKGLLKQSPSNPVVATTKRKYVKKTAPVVQSPIPSSAVDETPVTKLKKKYAKKTAPVDTPTVGGNNQAAETPVAKLKKKYTKKTDPVVEPAQPEKKVKQVKQTQDEPPKPKRKYVKKTVTAAL